MYHTLVDNDIRHIINSRGEKTNEKYPVTAEDLRSISDIVKNYDDVLYVPRKDGAEFSQGENLHGINSQSEFFRKAGIYYVKRHNGVTYYLEAIKSGDVLANKQMIKTETGTIPDIKELKDAINKKWNSSSLGMNNIPPMYVQDVKETVHIDSISENGTDVKRKNNTVDADEVLPDIGDKKTATGFGDEGAQLVAERMHKGKSLEEAQKAVKPMYIAGFTGGDVKRAKTDIQKKAFNAGASDKVAQREAARSKAKKSTVRNGSLRENEASKKLDKVDREIIKTVAKDLGLKNLLALQPEDDGRKRYTLTTKM